MKKVKMETVTINEEPVRRLSIWRLFMALIILVGIVGGSVFGWYRWQDVQAANAFKPWFGSYVDATATPIYPFEQLGASTTPNVVLSFIVSSADDVCSPSWGKAYSLNRASDELDLDRRIARLRQQGGNVVVSFGGQLNDELAVKCNDQAKLEAAYQAVIDRYGLDTIDLDIEGADLSNLETMKLRAVVMSRLQQKQRAANKHLAIWLTLPVTPQGLTKEGTDAVALMLSNGVDLAGVNVMTMDYGNSKPANMSMGEAGKKALTETQRQLGILYQQAGVHLNSATLWRKIGATPMIGQNDDADEVFGLTDASDFNQFAMNQGVGRMSMWSANRDIQCGDNYVNTKVVSDSCSGVKQDKLAFATKLSLGFEGELSKSAAIVTTPDASAKAEQPDDPKSSPYQIWRQTARYLEGTKVVWHHNVYQAKWWTQGELPDNPVLSSWETPWQLLGPVLPGEKPVPQPTLAPGTYSDWSASTIYNGGQRVLLDGIGYQAKWWTKGNNPADSIDNPDSSPWLVLTPEQIKELQNGN